MRAVGISLSRSHRRVDAARDDDGQLSVACALVDEPILPPTVATLLLLLEIQLVTTLPASAMRRFDPCPNPRVQDDPRAS